jgi:hypothetical protein
MMELRIYDDSKNYTCQVIKLPAKIAIAKLNNLVEVNVQGNSCLIGKDSPEDELYLFFPAECQISDDFLKKNNLYRHETLNQDPTQKGFFEDNRRVKALKFQGIISSGFVIPITSLREFFTLKKDNGVVAKHEDAYYNVFSLKPGDEFNSIDGFEICKKYLRRENPGKTGFQNPRTTKIDSLVDSKMAPEHIDTSQLMRNIHKLDLDSYIIVSYKFHGTSARTFRTLVKRKLPLKDRIARWLGIPVIEENYDYIAGSRRQLKSIGFEELPGKNHYYTTGDLWSEVARFVFGDKLNKGEAVYYEIVGKTIGGEAIQAGYTYGFNSPRVYVYRISNINPDGIEVDLSWEQMERRCKELGVEVCPVLFKGTVSQFITKYGKAALYSGIDTAIEDIFYNSLLEQPSILDNSVVEEGLCIRIEGSLRAETYKIKSKKFLAHESKSLDKGEKDMEEEQTEANADQQPSSKRGA